MKKTCIFLICFCITLSMLTSCKTIIPSSESTSQNSGDVSSASSAEITASATTSGSSSESSASPSTEISSSGSSLASGSLSDTDILMKAKQILVSMSLKEKVGQMFIVRCPSADAADQAKEYAPGGYILYGTDFKNKTSKEVISTIQSYQDVSKIKMIIAVDEEGGTVNRVSLNSTLYPKPFLSPSDLYEKGGWDLIADDTTIKAHLLKSLGINVNLAPVCDVSVSSNDYIFARSFGKDAQLTSLYVKNVVETMSENQMGCVLKHFPGYGNNVDTHTGIAFDKRSYETFVRSDFLPFQAGIDAGAGAVLVSHNIVDCMDAARPASLSAEVHRILREELGFTGVIMTDDLNMDAIREYTGDSAASVAAVLAGNDMICCTNFREQIPAVIQAVNDGKISQDAVDSSVIRVLVWKISCGIL